MAASVWWPITTWNKFYGWSDATWRTSPWFQYQYLAMFTMLTTKIRIETSNRFVRFKVPKRFRSDMFGYSWTFGTFWKWFTAMCPMKHYSRTIFMVYPIFKRTNDRGTAEAPRDLPQTLHPARGHGDSWATDDAVMLLKDTIYACIYMNVCNVCMDDHVCMYGCMDVWMYGCR